MATGPEIAHNAAMAYRKTQRVQEQLADKRVRILEAARRLVSRGGFRGTGIDDVATAAGIATGTVYRYFPSKAALFVEVVSRVSEREVDMVAAIARKTDAAPVLLDDAVRAFALRALANRRLAYALIVEPSDPEVEAVRLLYRRKLAEVFSGIIETGMAAGDFPRQAAEIAGTCIVGALLEALIGPLARDDLAPGIMVSSIVAFCASAVRGSSSERVLRPVG
jgi:AcrR family transcriptional regulator